MSGSAGRTLFGHESHDEVCRVSRHLYVLRDLQVLAPLDDFSTGLFGVVRTERRVADEHLEEDGSDRPPVDDLSVPVLVEDFRCDVVRRADERVHLLSVLSVVRQGLLVVVLFVATR